jgi:cation diffusion facilitator CzcD-associated flavoprotein CzcO
MALVFSSKFKYFSLLLNTWLIYLSNWKWPDIPGLHSFKGDLMHSAAWKDNYDVKGKKVAVLGCGSSGVQIVPSIQPGESSISLSFLREFYLT